MPTTSNTLKLISAKLKGYHIWVNYIKGEPRYTIEYVGKTTKEKK